MRTMTVSRLIEELEKMPKDADVYFYNDNELYTGWLVDVELDSDEDVKLILQFE